jgi:enamine deaminase RidA (YjgF/YER057c/UK114 family)
VSAPVAAAGDYEVAVLHAGVIQTAGMTPRDDDGTLRVRGRVGVEVSVADARELAGRAALRALAAAEQVAGGAGVERVLTLAVYIACDAAFHELSHVADGASAALRERLGAHGRPARTAVGVASLPGGAPVEVQLACVAGRQPG